MSRYELFHELIIVGHGARLSPEEIHARIIADGIEANQAPPVHVIRSIGLTLIGPTCRWRAQGRMVSWSSGTAIKGQRGGLQPARRVVE